MTTMMRTEPSYTKNNAMPLKTTKSRILNNIEKR
jgi:hypothetical protein